MKSYKYNSRPTACMMYETSSILPSKHLLCKATDLHKEEEKIK